MGVSEVLEILRKNSNEITSSEIADKVDASIIAVQRALASLLKDVSEDLNFRILSKEEKEERYGHKTNCKVRVYWLNE